MSQTKGVFIGTDSGATTSKTGGVWADGTIISTKLRQSSTNSQAGTANVIKGWIEGVNGFLKDNNLTWEQVIGVGLALPGPYKAYGILDRSPNLPASFEGWEFAKEYAAALAQEAGRQVPLICGNDGNFGGVSEAQRVRGEDKATVLMFAPGSGLGVAYVDQSGLPMEGDTLAGMEGGHMALPLQLLGEGIPIFRCGCGKPWGCVEAYTTISGLPQLFEHFIKQFPDHELAKSDEPIKAKCFSLRTRAQKGDPLALAIFDFQAKAMGINVAQHLMVVDARYVVIGGGLMDIESTTPEFRARYLNIVRDTMRPYLWPAQRDTVKVVEATLGELSQAIGAALVALYTDKKNKR